MSLIIVKLSWKLSSLKCKYGDHMNGGFIPLCLSEGTYPNLKMALYIFKHQYLLKAVGVIQYLWVKIPQQAFKTQPFNKPDILGRCRVYFLINLPIKYPKMKSVIPLFSFGNAGITESVCLRIPVWFSAPIKVWPCGSRRNVQHFLKLTCFKKTILGWGRQLIFWAEWLITEKFLSWLTIKSAVVVIRLRIQLSDAPRRSDHHCSSSPQQMLALTSSISSLVASG